MKASTSSGKAFFPDHAGEVADDGRRWGLAYAVAFEIDSVRHDFDAKAGRVQSLPHEVGIELAGSDEKVGVGEPAAQLGPAIGSERFGETVEETVLALEIADDFYVETLLELTDHARLKSGAEAKDVRLVDGEPVDEFIKLLAEVAVLDAEHGQCHRTVHAGGGHVAALGSEPEEIGVI